MHSLGLDEDFHHIQCKNMLTKIFILELTHVMVLYQLYYVHIVENDKVLNIWLSLQLE